MTLTLAAFLVELIWTLQAVAGIAVMLLTAVDNRISLRAYHERGENGLSESLASIGFWDGIAGVLFHGSYLIIGVLSLLTPPDPKRPATLSGILIGWGFVLIQAAVLGIQIRNQSVRIRSRS